MWLAGGTHLGRDTHLAAVGLCRLFRPVPQGSFQHIAHSLEQVPGGRLAPPVLRVGLGTHCQQALTGMLQSPAGLPLAHPEEEESRATPGLLSLEVQAGSSGGWWGEGQDTAAVGPGEERNLSWGWLADSGLCSPCTGPGLHLSPGLRAP